eukprot:19968-Heterococcus_DN1.PRE.1
MAGALENSNAVFTISYRTSRKGKAAAKGSSKGKGKAKAASTLQCFGVIVSNHTQSASKVCMQQTVVGSTILLLLLLSRSASLCVQSLCSLCSTYWLVLALNSCNTAAATSVVDIEHIDDDEETMSISTLTSATASTVQHIYSKFHIPLALSSSFREQKGSKQEQQQ